MHLPSIDLLKKLLNMFTSDRKTFYVCLHNRLNQKKVAIIFHDELLVGSQTD
jgi:hypothetical protein